MNRRDFIKNSIAVAALGAVVKFGANAESFYDTNIEKIKDSERSISKMQYRTNHHSRLTYRQ